MGKVNWTLVGPGLSVLGGTYTYPNWGGSNTFTWDLIKQPIAP